MKKVVLILSGGMDSTTLLYDLIHQEKDVYSITYDYGQKHKKEIIMAQETCKKLGVPHKIINLTLLNEIAPSALTRDNWEVPEGHYSEPNMKQTVVPNRNMVMISIAVSHAIGIGATEVYYAAHSGDHAIYPDCRKEFISKLNEAIELCDWEKISLKAPYANLDKGDIAIRGRDLGVDYSLTWTCYKGGSKACGKCGSCVERLEAFEKAKLKDPLDYETN
ncbi:MAG: 7-cyano-7-deazaguanine synthase QueC [Promethearchaeota archaeon]